MIQNDRAKIRTNNPKYEKRYWMRVWIVGRALATGWSQLPNTSIVVWRSLKELSGAVWQLLLNIVLPLTCIAAPFWLWVLERDIAKKSAKRNQEAVLMSDFAEAHQRQWDESEKRANENAQTLR